MDPKELQPELSTEPLRGELTLRELGLIPEADLANARAFQNLRKTDSHLLPVFAVWLVRFCVTRGVTQFGQATYNQATFKLNQETSPSVSLLRELTLKH